MPKLKQTHNEETAVLPDKDILINLRKKRPALKRVHAEGITVGERVADKVAATVGSWPFIILQTIILIFWITANIFAWIKEWDPYPFILLNLMLSFQSAYAAPIIMMAQNRQGNIDRKKVEKDYDVNLKAELEIESLHQKIDLMRELEMKRLTDLVEELIRTKKD